ncbi:MAG: LysR family transcriptional regulator [Pseudomonadota bacterium]
MKKHDVLSLDGKLLKTFLAVFEEESVTRAAEVLGTSQSAVSHGLDRLRECIGDPLFIKKGRGITPTHVAAAIAPKVSELLADLEGLTLQSDYDPATDRTTFTIATNVLELMPVLMVAKRLIRRCNCDLPLRFIELGGRTNAGPMLSSGSADLAITVAIGSHPLELWVERFYHDQIVCFYDPTQREAPKTLEQYCAARHAVVDFGGASKSLIDAALETSGGSRRIYLSASNSYALASFARGTDLVISMPKRLERTAFQGFASSYIPLSVPMVSYDILCHRRMRESSRNVWFREVLKEAASTLVPLG